MLYRMSSESARCVQQLGARGPQERKLYGRNQKVNNPAPDAGAESQSREDQGDWKELILKKAV
jgi:hypothetical protein